MVLDGGERQRERATYQNQAWRQRACLPACCLPGYSSGSRPSSQTLVRGGNRSRDEVEEEEEEEEEVIQRLVMYVPR